MATAAHRRGTRRAIAIAGALAYSVLFGSDGASAATFTVNTTADESGAGASCSLREALEAANTDGVFGGCTGTDDATDTIVLAAATYGRTVPEPLPIENENVIITGNGATIQGTDLETDGAVFDIFDVNATMSNLTIRDGFAFTGNNGGGIDMANGAVNPGTATLNLSNSTVTSNTALAGGGIAGFNVDVNLTNVTASGNASLNPAAGLDFHGGDSVLRNVTVTGNVAPGQGGGLYVSQGAIGGTHTVLNSIIAGNQASSSPDCFEGVGVTLVSAGRVLIGDPTGCSYTAGSGDKTGPAGLGPLADNGGGTPTHGLQPGSQAIDAGNPGTPDGGAFRCEPIDQRGVGRPVGPFCDMGAFEGTLPLPPLPAPLVEPPPVVPSLGNTVLCAALRAKLKKAASKKKKRKIRRQIALAGC